MFSIWIFSDMVGRCRRESQRGRLLWGCNRVRERQLRGNQRQDRRCKKHCLRHAGFMANRSRRFSLRFSAGKPTYRIGAAGGSGEAGNRCSCDRIHSSRDDSLNRHTLPILNPGSCPSWTRRFTVLGCNFRISAARSASISGSQRTKTAPSAFACVELCATLPMVFALPLAAGFAIAGVVALETS
jgi:hypothetical protein